MPRLSIIVPVYNVAKYLERCLDSILNQTFTDYELILVDDGSTDESAEMCDAYTKKDDRISVIHQSNHGQAYARNIAIKKSKGDYIGFIDSDDWIETEMYQHLFDSIYKYGADIALCRVRKVDTAENILEIIGPEETTLMDRVAATIEILKDELILSYPVNKIYRRDLFDGVEFPVGRIFEDTATTYKTFYKAAKVVAIPYIGYNYLQNPSGTCRTIHREKKKYLDRELFNALAFDERYVFAKEHEDLRDIVPLCAYKAYQMIRSFIHMLGHKGYELTQEQEEIVDKIMQTFDKRDLSLCTKWDKMDLVMFHLSKRLLKMYISIVPSFHKMKE